MSKPKAAIVLLTKGYPSIQYYEKLIKRNTLIYEKFNKHLGQQYPLLIFHEGNILDDHQNAIIEASKNQTISFINIAKDFIWPENIPMYALQDTGFHPGYRLMCKFNCFHIWKYVKDYDYIFRIDEDTFIGELKYDVFQYMQDNNMDYLVSRFCEEYHALTNSTIPAVAHNLLGDKYTEDMYDQSNLWVPLTNLYVARTGLFLQDEVQTFLKKLTSDPRFLTHRWGDHVVMGIVLKAFSTPAKISYVHNFTHYHGSHDCVTTDGKAVEGILGKREAKVFGLVPSGRIQEQELYNHYIKPQ